MGIVLIVAVLVIAAAMLYITVTLSTRTRQSTAPLIDDAFKGVSGQIDAAAQDLRRQIADGRQQDMEQLRTDGRRIQGHLDHLDSQASGMTSQVLAELDTIRRLVEQLGARQDQLGADVGKLDHQVARLGGSLARLSGPPAAPAAPAQAAAGGPAIVPGQLYAERLGFAHAGAQPESASARSERQFRIQVERQIGALPSPQPGVLNNPSTIIQLAGNDAGFRAWLSRAAPEYFATKPGSPAFAVVTERWVTQDAYPETDLVEVCNRISNGLQTIVERPFEKPGTELRLPGPQAAPGTGAGLILLPVAEPLGRAATFLEITGVVVGLSAGFHPLALAAAKMLAHDEFHDFVARRLREAARQVFEGPAEDQRPLRPAAEPPEPGRAPTAPAQPTWAPDAPTHPTLRGAPPVSPPTRPEPQGSPETRPADPADPGWDDGPAMAGPGSG
jgi:hypothetical protein